MKLKKVISLSTAVSLGLSMFSQLYVSADAADGETYTCNFMQLVDSGADTQYGNAENIIPLDDYTTAYLTYEGTYVSADGAVHLRGKTPTNDRSDYTNGSYIAFTAPSDGNVTMKGSAIGFYLDDQYQSYGSSKTFDISKGQTLYGGYRTASSYVSELTFVPAPQETPAATPDIGSDPEREVLYEENFESYQDGENGGWTTPAGKVSVKTDSNSGINKYLAATSNKSGTARSSYKEIPAVTDSFVLEADIKSSSFSTNVSAFEMLENRSSLYMNHGCYSNAKYAFKMNRPAGLNQYVINNKVSDSGLSLDKYDQPAVLTDEIPDDWLHLKVIGDYDSKTATTYLTSLDRSEVFYHGRTDMSEDINSFALLALLAPSTSNDTCIDNIKISKALESDLSEVFYTVTINDGISEFSQYVYDGENAVNIPDMTIYGDYFLGWNVNGETKTPQDLSALPIKSDTSVTAMISPDYIENLADVEFSSFPADNKLVMGADENTYGDNEISLKITGERGTSLVTNPDSRVQDYTINWTFTGFRSLNGVPTGDTGFVYCDSYALCEVTEPDQS